MTSGKSRPVEDFDLAIPRSISSAMPPLSHYLRTLFRRSMPASTPLSP